MKPLNPRQSAFVQEYMIDLNATQAAIRAGYSAKNANVVGPRVLANVGVADTIAKAQAARAQETARTALDVLKDIQADTRAARESGDLKTSLRGLELEGKHLGMFTDKMQLLGQGGGDLVVRLVTEIVDAGTNS